MVYNRYHGDGQKDVLNKALTCQTSFPTRQYNVRIGGFIKQTPFSNGGGRTPENGVHTFPDFAIVYNGLSESHGRTYGLTCGPDLTAMVKEAMTSQTAQVQLGLSVSPVCAT